MTELGKDDFERYFIALWDKPPFAWQQTLAEQVLSGDWPEAIALATGAGKTACIDIAIFALAVQAPRLAHGQAIDAPRRVFFVVDRRVVVDAAFSRATTIARKLATAKDGILKTIGDNLRAIAWGDGNTPDADNLPLTTHVLRGGMYRSEAWAHSPLQPTIVCSTVDQIGSRLLFRGYGRGSGMWPIYAGLIANDALLLLDEAHCARPFLQTLQAVNQFRTWAKSPLDRTFRPVVMSATPPAGLRRFNDDSDQARDPNHPLGRRQLAAKPTTCEVVKNAKGKNAHKAMAEALVKAALELTAEQPQAVVVFANRVATARAAAERLKSKHRNVDSLLLTGRMRAWDKDRISKTHLPILSSDAAEKRRLERPLIVVATQTLEVGADLDFDALVTECAALDALRQRFGRLNRTGRTIAAHARILIRGDQLPGSKPDPIYGTALASTWAWLREQNDEIDFGIHALTTLLPEDASSLAAPAPDAPVMLPAHLDSLVQTAPVPMPSPDVALFLHGPRDHAADVQICWRADLPLDADRVTPIPDGLVLCPPSSIETVPVPISTFRQWFNDTLIDDDSSDLEGADAGASATEDAVTRHRAVIVWRGRGEASWVTDARKIRPGDVIVLPAAEPDALRLGDIPDGAALDIGDAAHRLARAKPLLRLHRSLIALWPDSPAKATAETLLKDLSMRWEEDPDGVTEAVSRLLAALVDGDVAFAATHPWLGDIAADLRREFRASKQLLGAIQLIDGGLVVVGKRLIPSLRQQADGFSDESDATASGTSRANGRPVLLREHLPGVGAFARRFASGSGLSQDFVDAIATAGLLHDLGKADPRFRALLAGGNPWARGEPLAKSGAMRVTRADFERARHASGYPPGARHELLSVRMAESAPEFLPDDATLRDLVLHLIATHHGHCRPLAPVVDDAANIHTQFELNGHPLSWRGPTGLERIDAGPAERFWRLVRQYGWWGLAWLEALLRLADHRRSEWEELHDDDD